MRKIILCLLLSRAALADTPPPGIVKLKGGTDGTTIGNVSDSIKVNVTNPGGGTQTVNQGTQGSAGSPWWVNVTNANIPVTQSGVWTVGATISNFPSIQAVSQSGTWNVGLSTGSNTIGKVDQGVGGVSAWKVDGSATTQPISGSVTATQPTGTNLHVVVDSAPTTAVTQSGAWTTGRTWSLLNTTDSVNVGNYPATQAVTQSTTPWVVSGTVTSNIGTTNGLALDTSIQSFLGSPAGGTAATKSGLFGGIYNTSLPTLTNGQQSSIQLDSSSRVIIRPLTSADVVSAAQFGSWTVTANAGTNLNTSALALESGGNLDDIDANTDALNLTQGSTTSGEHGPLIQGAVTTSAPTYTTGQTNPISLTTGGALRTAAQIGNASGTADFNTGTVSAQTLRVTPATDVTQKVQNNLLSATGTSSALNATPIPATDVSNYQCLRLQVTGTSTQTLTMQGSGDDATWLTLNQLKDVSVQNAAAQGTIANTGGESIFQMPITVQFVRLISTAYTSGTMTVSYVFTSLPCSQDQGIRTVTVNAPTLTSGTLTSQATTTDIASAARIVTFTSASINPSQGSMSEAYGLDVTAVSGTTPTMDCTLFESNDTGANFQAVYQWERIIATGQYWVPSRRISGNRIQYQCVIAGTTPSFTFTLFRIDSQAAAPMWKRFFDRTIVPNSLNSTTATFNVSGCNFISYGVDVAGVTTPATFDLQLSEDGTNFESQGITITPAANSSKSIQALQLSSKFARAIVTTAGTGETLGYAWLRCGGN